jgi:hypothetical protein
MISLTLRLAYATAILAFVATGLASANFDGRTPTFATKNPGISSLGYHAGDMLR